MVGSRVMTWMIGFKPSENSNLRCGVRVRADNAQHRIPEPLAFLVIAAQFFGCLGLLAITLFLMIRGILQYRKSARGFLPTQTKFILRCKASLILTAIPGG